MEKLLKHKRIPDGALTFKTKEHTYRFTETLSSHQYNLFEIFQVECGYDPTFENVYKAIADAIKALNEVKFVDAAAILFNLQNGMYRNIEKREHPVMMLCTLFILREDEDVRTWDETLAKEKVKDWMDYGYPVQDFFHIAFKLVPELLVTFKDNFPDISTEKQEAK